MSERQRPDHGERADAEQQRLDLEQRNGREAVVIIDRPVRAGQEIADDEQRGDRVNLWLTRSGELGAVDAG